MATFRWPVQCECHLIKMLKITVEQMEKGANVLIEVESNCAGKLIAEFTDIPLPDLRQLITNPENLINEE